MLWTLRRLADPLLSPEGLRERIVQEPNLAERFLEYAAYHDAVAFGLRYLPHHFRSTPAPFHFEIAERLATRTYDAVAAPRSHAKSTLVSLAHPLLEAATGRASFILLIGSDVQAAEDKLEDILNELADNKQLIADFPRLRPPDPRELREWARKRKKVKQRRSDFVTLGGVRFSARGAGQAMRGLKQGNRRPDLIILDDVEDDRHVRSGLQRKRLLEWFEQVVLNLEGVERARIRVVGTVLHPKGLLATLIERWGGKIYRAILDEEQQRTLWPEVWPYERLVLKRDGGVDADGTPIKGIGHLSFRKEYQNEPPEEEGGMLKAEWLRKSTVPLGFPASGKVYVGLDLAIGTSEQSAYNALVVHYYHAPSDKTYVVDAYRWRGLGQIDEEVQRFLNEHGYRPDCIAVEGVQFQMKIVQDIRKRLPHKVVAVLPERDKAARFSVLVDQYSMGRVVHLSGLPQEYEQELLDFPHSEFKDWVDASVFAYLARFVRPAQSVVSTAVLTPGRPGEWS